MELIATTERIMRTNETCQWGAVFNGSWCGFLLSRNQASNFGQTRFAFLQKLFETPMHFRWRGLPLERWGGDTGVAWVSFFRAFDETSEGPACGLAHGALRWLCRASVCVARAFSEGSRHRAAKRCHSTTFFRGFCPHFVHTPPAVALRTLVNQAIMSRLL